ERGDGWLTLWMLRRDIHEHADAPDLLRLLRAGGERPYNGRTSYDFDEIAASHYSPQSSGARRLPTDYIRDLRPAEWGLAFILRGNNPRTKCPLWVKSGHSAVSEQCPLYPQKRTLVECVEMSALCQKRTNAPQQLTPRLGQVLPDFRQ